MAPPAASSPDAVNAAAGIARTAGRMPRLVRQANKEAEPDVASWARTAGRRGSRQQRRMSGGIGTDATGGSLSVVLRNTSAAPAAIASFRGASRRTGWFSRPRYRRSLGRQFPPWVGRDGASPAGEAVADQEKRLLEGMAETYTREIVKALPNGRMR